MSRYSGVNTLFKSDPYNSCGHVSTKVSTNNAYGIRSCVSSHLQRRSCKSLLSIYSKNENAEFAKRSNNCLLAQKV